MAFSAQDYLIEVRYFRGGVRDDGRTRFGGKDAALRAILEA